MEAEIIGVSEKIFASEFIFKSLVAIGNGFEVAIDGYFSVNNGVLGI